MVWMGSIGVLVALGLSAGLAGEAPRVLPAGQLPADVRLQPLKDLDGYFPFQPAASVEAWAPRAEEIRRRVLVSLGLWPLPTRTPLNAVVHGRIDRDSYTVEKVYFESMPGFFVTGNLYRPKGRSGRLPGVLCPHGHWANGRFMDYGIEEVRKEIERGAERFEEGGRSPLQARCVQLARMGCVVFHYDMIGYADSVQISQELAHGFAKQRPEMNAAENWGLFSPQAEAHAQSVMGLQTWNSMRALDFLLELPDVDSTRIGVTGASGGGTQTFILGAVDSRPTVAFPAVMVSTAMQGGCTCENACGLRVGMGNVDFAAMFAPKPLGMTAANDWTREMPTKGFPELERHYALLGAPDMVALTARLEFGHNYNSVGRAAMYSWMNRHLRLGHAEPIVEQDYRRLTREEMSVWDAQHPRPAGGPDFERGLLRWWTEDTTRQLRAALATSGEFRRLAGGALEVVVGRRLPKPGEVTWKAVARAEASGVREFRGLLRNGLAGEELPSICLVPARPKGRVVVWVDGAGKEGLGQRAADGSWKWSPAVSRLLDKGHVVLGVDLFLQGEFLADGQPVRQTRRVKNEREAAAYTFGYNPSLFAQRVQDLLSVLSWVRSSEASAVVGQVNWLGAVGFGEAAPWVLAARAVAGGAIDAVAVDTAGFRFQGVRDIRAPEFLPGGARYLDLPGVIALGAPGALWLAGEGMEVSELPAEIRMAYAGAAKKLRLAPTGGEAAARAGAAVKWLLSVR